MHPSANKITKNYHAKDSKESSELVGKVHKQCVSIQE
jgi:hypothetical protein